MNVGGARLRGGAERRLHHLHAAGETLAYNKFLFKKPGYDAEKDFEPITNPFFNIQVLVVNAKLNVKTLDELVALSKAKPGTLSYDRAVGAARAVHGEAGRRRPAPTWCACRSRAAARRSTASSAARRRSRSSASPTGSRYLQAGSVNGLAIDGAQRSPLFPDIPTLAELGYRDNLTRVYFGIVAPAGTPQPIVHKLRDEFARIGSDPAFRQKRLIESGLDPVFDTPEEFAKFLDAGSRDFGAGGEGIGPAAAVNATRESDHRTTIPFAALCRCTQASAFRSD